MPRNVSTLQPGEEKVCRRLRLIREEIKWSQPNFAHNFGLTRERLASYEYGRAPVRYRLGNAVCEALDINQRWFASGEGPRHHWVPIPRQIESKIPDRATFFEAYRDYLNEAVLNKIDSLMASAAPMITGPERQSSRRMLTASLKRILPGKTKASEYTPISLKDLFYQIYEYYSAMPEDEGANFLRQIAHYCTTLRDNYLEPRPDHFFLANTKEMATQKKRAGKKI